MMIKRILTSFDILKDYHIRHVSKLRQRHLLRIKTQIFLLKLSRAILLHSFSVFNQIEFKKID